QEPKDTSNQLNYLVMGPWRHSQVNYDGSSLGSLKWAGDTALEFRRDVLKPFFDQYLKDGAPKADTPPVFIYNTGENHWDRLKSWPLACETCGNKSKPLYLTANFGLSFTGPASAGSNGNAKGCDEDVSEPAKAGPVAAAAGVLRGWRGLAAMAGDRSALRRWTPGRADLCHAAVDRISADQRAAGGESGRLDQRHRQRLGGEVDRRVSGRSAQPG